MELGKLGGWLYLLTLLCVVPALLALWRGWYRPVPAADWAKAHGFTLSDEALPKTAALLLTWRRFRTVGLLAAWELTAISLVVLPDMARPYGLTLLVGYFIGDRFGDWWLHRSLPVVRGASLDTRRVHDYMPAWLTWAMRTTVLGLAVLLTLFASQSHFKWGPYPGNQPPATLEETRERLPVDKDEVLPYWIFQTAAAAAVVGLGEVVRFRIARRRQAVVSDEARAIDDALRADSIHRTAACSGILVLLIACSVAQGVVRFTDRPAYSWLNLFLLVAQFPILGLIGWCDPLIGWRVRRRRYSLQAVTP